MLEIYDDIDTEVESEVSECENDLVVQECVDNSLEEDEVTLDSSIASLSLVFLRTGCSRGSHVMYDWKEISDSNTGGDTTTCNACFRVIICAK